MNAVGNMLANTVLYPLQDIVAVKVVFRQIALLVDQSQIKGYVSLVNWVIVMISIIDGFFTEAFTVVNLLLAKTTLLGETTWQVVVRLVINGIVFVIDFVQTLVADFVVGKIGRSVLIQVRKDDEIRKRVPLTELH